jgi:hypothetical protein
MIADRREVQTRVAGGSRPERATQRRNDANVAGLSNAVAYAQEWRLLNVYQYDNPNGGVTIANVD